ncbi:MAG: DUF2163 domain-containing protein [Caulobacteraceae bacterium]
MRDIPTDLATRIESGAANLCACWLVTRADGERLGFTDHDEGVVLGAVVCRAASGWTPGMAEAELGFSPGTASAAGALDSDAISEADIALGLYDGAAVECWRVDWSEPSLAVRLWAGTIRRLVREGSKFTAEIEGPLAALDRVAGRAYGRLCDAALGDMRCKADVTGPAFNGSGEVVAVEDNRRLTVSGLDGFAAGWFARGRITFAGGSTSAVAAHDVGAGVVVLTLDERPLREIAPGDAFTVRAGCDKRWAACRAKFTNGLNFQGFPHIPGDDFLLAHPSAGEVHDGGSRLIP